MNRTPPRTLSLALALLATASLLAQARQPSTAVAPVEASVPFRVGETLQYDVSWSSFLTAGTATLQVRDKKPSYGSIAFYITAEGATTSLVAALYPLYYKADTLLDVYSLLPQRAAIFSRERGKEQMKETLFDQRRHQAMFIAQSGGRAQRGFRIPPATHDPLSALFWLRTLPMKNGLRVTVPVTFNGTIYDVQMTVAGRESVGNRRAWRVTPVVTEGANEASPRKMTLWISDDARRVPIRMSAELAVGTFDLTLRGER